MLLVASDSDAHDTQAGSRLKTIAKTDFLEGEAVGQAVDWVKIDMVAGRKVELAVVGGTGYFLPRHMEAADSWGYSDLVQP